LISFRQPGHRIDFFGELGIAKPEERISGLLITEILKDVKDSTLRWCILLTVQILF
jgi:hypothetical protein